MLYVLEVLRVKKFVLTGGLCSGKTTTLGELSNRGFYVTPEIGRIICRYNLHMKNYIKFAIKLEEIVPQEIDLIFMDRSAIDSLAFSKVFGKKIELDLYKLCKERKYNKVFFLEMLPVYSTDYYRDQPIETAKKIAELIKEVYTELGYNLVYVPVMAIKDRANFILEKLN